MTPVEMVQRAFWAALLVGVTCPSWVAQGTRPLFEDPVLLRTVDQQPIDTESFSIPTLADLDGDGDLDLVVGQFMNHRAPWLRKPGGSGSSGTATWYRNDAKASESPAFAQGEDLRSEDGLLYAANW